MYALTKGIQIPHIISAEIIKGGNYSRAETIIFCEVLAAESIQGRKVFKGGNYMRKCGIPNNRIVLKGLSSKPSGKCIVAPNLCFLSKRRQILATCLLFYFL